jgi:pentatricopeptide repeat protein
VRSARNGRRHLVFWGDAALWSLSRCHHYSAAINACEKGGLWQHALGLLAVMQQSCLGPDVVTYSAAISACTKGEQWQQALGLSAVMQQSCLVPDVIAYNAAISTCEKGEWGQQALDLLALMQQSGLVPDVITYSAALSAYEKAGQWQQALGRLGGDAAVWSRAPYCQWSLQLQGRCIDGGHFRFLAVRSICSSL